jgi:hypothetical protein
MVLEDDRHLLVSIPTVDTKLATFQDTMKSALILLTSYLAVVAASPARQDRPSRALAGVRFDKNGRARLPTPTPAECKIPPAGTRSSCCGELSPLQQH